MSASFLEHFAPLQDPRVERNQRHALLDIVLLVVCAVASGAGGWETIEEFGREKLEWLRKFAAFANGVPSHERIANVVSRLTPNGFGECFRRWTHSTARALAARGIGADPRGMESEAKPSGPRSVWARAPRRSGEGAQTRRRRGDLQSAAHTPLSHLWSAARCKRNPLFR